MVSLSANAAGEDLGRIAARVDEAIARAGAPPRGANVAVRGQIAPMRDTLRNIGVGLLSAVVVIFLLLAANFQSVRLAFVVISTVPAVLAGVALMLLATRTTLNVQSFMGAVMAIGVAVANAILLVTFAEQARQAGDGQPAIAAARARMRPVLMTSAAMIAGMLPMALAIGEGAGAAGPLGRAAIGGLAAATLATLFVLPSVYSLAQPASWSIRNAMPPVRVIRSRITRCFSPCFKRGHYRCERATAAKRRQFRNSRTEKPNQRTSLPRSGTSVPVAGPRYMSTVRS